MDNDVKDEQKIRELKKIYNSMQAVFGAQIHFTPEDFKEEHSTPDYNTLGEVIKATRENSNLTQQELAKKMGVAQQRITEYERDVRDITVKKLFEIAKALDTKPSVLLQKYELTIINANDAEQ